MKSVRLERINSEIQKALSNIIDNDIRDPQIDAIISVTQVSVTPDLSYAKVYLTSIGKTQPQEVVNRIKGAGGFIRLEFILDTSEDYSNKIENILKDIKYTTAADEDKND